MTRPGAGKRLAVMAIGDELLAGAHPDLNSPMIAHRLSRLGFEVIQVRVLPDHEERIAEALLAMQSECDLIVVTGGLGPTLDDVTRHGIARAVGVDLVENEEAIQTLAGWHAQRRVPMAEANRRQALFPRGAEVIHNRAGTAPGFWVRGTADIISLPGPPFEMGIVLEEEVEPRLVARGMGAEPLAERRFYLFGLSESVFADRIGSWMERDASPRMGCSVKKGVLGVVFRAVGEVRSVALAELDERATQFEARFRRHIFSTEEPRLEYVLGTRLIEEGVSVSLAESCTGGLVGSLLTRVPGVSAVFQRGFLTYDDDAKSELLGVDKQLLEERGAVSREVAEAMASGAARAAGARLGISTTGVAGPGGGSPEKPVGLVWIGTSLDGVTRARELRLPDRDRNWIRTYAARCALHEGWGRLQELAGPVLEGAQGSPPPNPEHPSN